MRSVNIIRKQLDAIDKKILVCLLKDSRTKFIDIANECSVSVSNIKNRYCEMKKTGIIKSSTIIVNATKIGFEGHLSVYVNVKLNEVAKFMRYVKALTTWQMPSIRRRKLINKNRCF